MLPGPENREDIPVLPRDLNFELRLAIAYDNRYGVEQLVDEENASLTQQDEEGNTPLHYAILIGASHRIIEKVLSQDNLNMKNERGQTPLILAVAHHVNPSRIVRLLINEWADLDAQDEEGNTALHVLVSKPVINAELIEKLLSFDARVNIKNYWNQTPLMIVETPGANGLYDEPLSELLRDYGGRALNNGLVEDINRHFNDKESTTVKSVEETIDDSAKALARHYRYENKYKHKYILDLTNWINNQFINLGKDIHSKTGKAKLALDNLLIIDIMFAGMTMQDALATVWMGVCDKHAVKRKEKGKILSEAEIELRKLRMIDNLYECQRGRNLDAQGYEKKENDDDAAVNQDAQICKRGDFDKIIAVLDGDFHDKVNIIYVTPTTIAGKAVALCHDEFFHLPEKTQRLFVPLWTKAEGLSLMLFEQYLKPVVTQKLDHAFQKYKKYVKNYHQAFTAALDNLQYLNPPPILVEMQNESVEESKEPELKKLKISI